MKHAVLVGVNQYQLPGNNLRGCVNDVMDMYALLQSMYGFAAPNTVLVLDSEATTKRIRQEFTRLVSVARPGDVCFFHYSGHGSQVPDKDGDEADNRDEIICPTDLDWKDPISDDWFREELLKVPDSVNFTMVFDSCHSGTATRSLTFLPIQTGDSIEYCAERYIAAPIDAENFENNRLFEGHTYKGKVVSKKRGWWENFLAAFQKRHGSNRPVPDVVPVDEMHELFISGCRADQTSADAYIEGRYNGALTYSIVKALKESQGVITYETLHTKVLESLVARNFTQRPQLSGKKDRFKAKFLEPLV